jgi:hypothetical protein
MIESPKSPPLERDVDVGDQYGAIFELKTHNAILFYRIFNMVKKLSSPQSIRQCLAQLVILISAPGFPLD